MGFVTKHLGLRWPKALLYGAQARAIVLVPICGQKMLVIHSPPVAIKEAHNYTLRKVMRH